MPDLKTVLERADRAVADVPLPRAGLDGLERRRDRKRRTQRIMAGTVGLAVFVAAVWFVTASGSPDRAQTPGGPGPDETGSTDPTPEVTSPRLALPPVGAAPSTPETGELLVFLDARPGDDFPASFVPVHQVWVYADGRVIYRTEGVSGSQFLERRLTPDGVDLLLSELLSSGLFDRDGTFTSPRWGSMTVRDGDRVVDVEWGCAHTGEAAERCWDVAIQPSARQGRELVRLSEGLADLASWLPASAWGDRGRQTPYVPSRYAICYRQYERPWRVLQPSEIWSVLPAAAQDLLLGKDKDFDEYATPFDDGPLPFDEDDPGVCSEMTLEEARALEEIFDAGVIARSGSSTLGLGYRFVAPDPIGAFDVSFDPILPHGRWELFGG